MEKEHSFTTLIKQKEKIKLIVEKRKKQKYNNIDNDTIRSALTT